MNCQKCRLVAFCWRCSTVQQSERFKGLPDLGNFVGSQQIREYGAASISDVLKNVQEMLTLMKKRAIQDSAGSEREQQNNCSSDVTFHNGRSCAPVLQAKKVRLFSKRGLGGGPLLEKHTDRFPKRAHLIPFCQIWVNRTPLCYLTTGRQPTAFFFFFFFFGRS
jgi:hypothetical protein